MIESSRRHGHSDPRYPVTYFAQFSPTSRAVRVAHGDAIAGTAVDGWEDEGGAPLPLAESATSGSRAIPA
jgi:hypothetical protein